jgi:hypothetical protein
VVIHTILIVVIHTLLINFAGPIARLIAIIMELAIDIATLIAITIHSTFKKRLRAAFVRPFFIFKFW